MFNNRQSFPMKSLVFTIVIALVGVACGPAPMPAEVEPTPTPARIPPTAVEVEAPLAPSQISGRVRFMVAAMGNEEEVLLDQIRRFEAQNPRIELEIDIVPYADYNERLLATVMAGVPPDVAVLTYNFVSELQGYDFLVALDEQAGQIDLNDFLPDALDSVIFNGQLYGLPWLRSACLPQYRYLSLFNRSEHPDAAFALMDFLTQSGQQAQNFTELEMFPTRKSAYAEFAIECPAIEAIRLTSDQVLMTIRLAQDLYPNLEPVLEGQMLNPYAATAVVEDGETQGTAVPLVYPFSTEQFKAALSEGVVIGALSVDQAPEYPVGDYAMKCWGDQETQCYLVPPEGEPIEVRLELVEETEGPVGQPSCIVVTGSKLLCFPIDRRRICIKVG